MILDLVATSIVIGIGFAMLAPQLKQLTPGESQVVQASFAMHVLSSVATIIVSEVLYQGLVDYNGFKLAGEMIADEMRQDFFGVAPRAIKLFFHSKNTILNIPLSLEPKGGSSSVSMWVLAAFGNLMFFRSFQAVSTAAALFSLSGKLAMLAVLRSYFPDRLRPTVAAALLLVPSVVYWTSGLIKEGIAVGGIGYALLGAHRLILMSRKERGFIGPGLAVSSLVFGVTIVLLIKPYLLMPFGMGIGAMLYSHRSRSSDGVVRIRPLWLLAAAAIALIGIILVGKLFPQFSLDNFGESAANMQSYGRKAAGGSTYVLGNPDERSFLGQLRFAPIALFTSLYRPMFFEARNVQMLINAIETTFILGASVLLVPRGWRAIVVPALSNPALAYSVAFALPLALGVGLVSNNLGTLSRYRCPLVPYFFLLVLVLLFARGRELYGIYRTTPAPQPKPTPYRRKPSRPRRQVPVAP